MAKIKIVPRDKKEQEQKKREEKRKRILKIGIPAVLGSIVAVILIWYSCYLFGWVKYTPLQVITGQHKPHCVVNEYKGFSYTVQSAELTDEDYNAYYSSLLELEPNYVKNDDRDGSIVRDGDVLNIDFVGVLNGLTFDGGTGEDYFLEIGSGDFVPGFEDALIGSVIGETVVIDVTFPDDYQNNPDLAGAQTVFTVTINYAADKLDEIDDAYVATHTAFSDIQTYKDEFLTEYLQADKDEIIRTNLSSEILNQLIDNTEFYNIDEEIDEYYNSMIQYYEDLAAGFGITLEDYANYTQGKTLSQFNSDMATYARVTIQEKYALEYVAKKEKLKVTDDIYEQYIDFIADDNDYRSREAFEAAVDKKEIKDMILTQYTLDTIISYAVPK